MQHTLRPAFGAAALVFAASVDKLSGPPATRGVRRCENAAPSGPPQYWDVTYAYRRVERGVQMSAAPGRTIAVNAKREPRI